MSTLPPASAPPEVTARESARAAATDLAELAEAVTLPGDQSGNARVADRLSEECAEIGAMLRALPQRPAAMSVTSARCSPRSAPPTRPARTLPTSSP